MSKPSYQFYPSLLDSYISYRECEEVWQMYWGNSDNPKKTLEEFREEKKQDLIDKINRVPMQWEDSEAADRGTCYNEVIDCLIEKRNSEVMKITKEMSPDGTSCEAIVCEFNKRTFSFNPAICKQVANKYPDALSQIFAEGEIHTKYGTVRLYGYLDGLNSDTIVDYKTTTSYSVGKFRDHMQHHIYPYCISQEYGQGVHHFIYDVAVIDKKSKQITELHEEIYPYESEISELKIRRVCEEFICFIQDNLESITHRRIFNE